MRLIATRRRTPGTGLRASLESICMNVFIPAGGMRRGLERLRHGVATVAGAG